MVFLIDTKCDITRIETVKILLKFENCFAINSLGKSEGLALLWMDAIIVVVQSYSRWHIHVETSWQGSPKCNLTRFYGHPEVVKREGAYKLIEFINSAIHLPWYCYGDFNEILNPNEKEEDSNHIDK